LGPQSHSQIRPNLSPPPADRGWGWENKKGGSNFFVTTTEENEGSATGPGKTKALKRQKVEAK